MIIKSNKKNKKIKFTNIFKKILVINFLFSISAITIFLIFFLSSWTFKKKLYSYLDYLAQAGRIEYVYIFNIGYQAFKSNFYTLDKINLNINFSNLLELENFRKKSVKLNSLGNSEDIPNIDATIGFGNKKIESSIRLKGERPVHFNNNKKSSYKVKIKGNESIYGMNNFSLQKPRIRNYLFEWLFLEMVGEFGLIKIKYKFANLDINGTNNGLYVLQEAFGKELLESNERRNGPIFGFDDNKVNFETKFKPDQNNPVFEIYDKKFWEKDGNFQLAKVASQKLNTFLSGDRKLEDTFDLEKFAALFAIIDFNYTYHSVSPGTLKLYYNPINGLFEPIAHDGQRGHPNYYKFNNRFNDNILIEYKNIWWVKKFFFNDERLNRDFYSLYLKYLKQISSKKFIKKFFKKKDKDIKKINSKIYADYFLYANGADFGPGIYYFNKKDFSHRAKIIKKKIDALNAQVYIINDGNAFKIQLFFKNCFKCKPFRTYTDFEIKKIFCKDEILVQKKINVYEDTYLKFQNITDYEKCSEFLVQDTLNQKFIKVKINHLNSNYDNQDYYELDNYKKFFDIKNKNLFTKKNVQIINENIFIPKNFKVVIKPGQKILITDNAFIFSKSPWLVKGSNDRPIEISGLKENFGGGLIISDTKDKSIFMNVNFKYLAGMKPEYKDIEGKILSTITYDSENSINSFEENVFLKKNLTNHGYIILGSLNFNNTNVELSDLKFEKISSEDALNIVKSKFEINNLLFNENKSDAIDIDFGIGSINNSDFKNIGNDGIDFSGSKVSITNVKLNNVGDKLISVGEKSNISILNLGGSNSFIGVACKDGSYVELKDVKFDNINIPFAAYNKKPTYKNGDIFLKNKPELLNFKKKWISDLDSKIIFQNKDQSIKSKTQNILSIIYKKELNILDDLEKI